MKNDKLIKLIDLLSSEKHFTNYNDARNYQDTIYDWAAVDCENDVGVEATSWRKKRTQKRKKGTEWKNFIERCRSAIEFGTLGDEYIKEACEIKSRCIHILSKKKKDGNLIWFDSRTKGSKSYKKYVERSIAEAAEFFTVNNPEVFFMTWTCDVKEYGGRVDFAWTKWLDRAYQKLHDLQKNLKCNYVCVFEATAKGFPHCHILLFFKRGTFKSYEHYPENIDLKYGSAFRTLRKFRPSTVWNLKKPKNEAVKFYLSKYISKSNSEMVAKIKDNKGDLSKESRKAIMSWLYPSIFNRKQWIKSKIKKVEEKNKWEKLGRDWTQEHAEKQRGKDIFTNMTDAQFKLMLDGEPLNEWAEKVFEEESRKSARGARRFLIYLCTKLECKKNKDVRMMSLADASEQFRKELAKPPEERREKAQIVWDCVSKSCCPGCFWMDFRDLVLGNLYNPLNVRFINVKNALETGRETLEECASVYITKEDYAHDLTFILKMGEIWNIWQKCCEGGLWRYERFKYFYSDRQKALIERNKGNWGKMRTPPIIFTASDEDKEKMRRAKVDEYCDIDFDMAANLCFDLKPVNAVPPCRNDGSPSLWRQRSEIWGKKGL